MNIETAINLINNAIKINKVKITIAYSKKIVPFLLVLKKEKYILAFKKNCDRKITIYFFFTYKKNKILNLKLLSKPSKKLYFSLEDLWKFEKTLYTVIVNTSKGIITHRIALKNSYAGEALCILL